jgi:large subunit ribosomal protein L25
VPAGPSPAARAGGRPLQSRTVAGERIKLVVSERTILGSSESRRLRRQGLIPGVVYGRSDPVAISVGERELRAALTSPAGSHAVLDVAISGGRSHSAILKDFQRDKVRGQIIHIDLQEVRLDQPIQTTVSVTLVGEPAGVKEGGILTQVANEVNVEALPLEVPQHLEADISGLGIGDSLRLGDLAIPAGVTLLDDPDSVLASVSHQTREEEPETAEAAGDEAAGEEPGGDDGEPASEA